MYFKGIELAGFKSFADQTNLSLEQGITAIVGPNGCGKSNVLDALRWALGEQSAKALRGAHMQDVIFNGSEQRPPTGMAEVTLAFDNGEGKLPVDFAEVQVTRRVYRSGESEYLLNKAPCRLRDIQELFMDTGIGTNAYSLIGQGKIDLVLSSKPDDRRFLFEEAAGIIKYKTRKRVAMRKMDASEQNLLRLQDIIAEVQRQMRSLKRQVNAAIRHRELTEALRSLEIRNAWLLHNELSGLVADLKEQFNENSEIFEKSSAETAKHEAQVEALGLKRIELERMLLARRDGEYQVESEMERLEGQIALHRRDIEFAKEQQEQALAEHEELTQRANSLGTAQVEIDEQSVALRKEVNEKQDELANEQAAHEAAQQAVLQADTELEALRQQALDTINTRNQTQTALETANVSMNNIDAQLEGIYNRQGDQSSRHETLAEQLQGVQGQETEKQKALSETVQQRQAIQDKRGSMTERMEALNQEWQGLREKKSSQEARLTSLRELRDSYEGFATGVRAVMMAKQREMPEAEGVIGPVGDLISSDKEYQRAMEAALGGNINNVVVEKADAAKSAIAFLKQHHAGRVTFLPLDTIRPSHRDDSGVLQGQPGVIGPAINYAQCDAFIMPAVEYLLFNTIIVETIDDAIRIARAERRFPRLVTLDGEVVSSAGAVTGGRTKHDRSGLLGRSAEIEELEKQVAYATKQINALSSEAAAITESLQGVTQEIKALTDAEETHRDELNALGVEVARLSTELESLTRMTQQLGSERDALLEQRKQLKESLETAKSRLESMETDGVTMEERTQAAQETAAKARQALSECSDRLSDLRVQLAELTQHMEEAERNKLREEREQSDATREAARRLEQVETLKARAAEHEKQIADNIERQKALSETKDEAHAKVLEVTTELDSVTAELDGLAKELKELRVRTAESQNLVHRLELELRDKESQAEHFEERILEEYNLALTSLTEEEVGSDEYDEDERAKLIAEYRQKLQRLGTVNLMAIEEYEELEQRNTFLMAQAADLEGARDKLMSVVNRIDEIILAMFMVTFQQISENFKHYFRRLFNGGQARIYLVDENDPLESGIEIEARPPGKKPQVLSLLSGGEQAMTAIALLFAIFNAKPSPFCVLDEVDAPLDDANIGRFLGIVKEFATQSQFIIITHNKQTMAQANALFGITQQEKGVSQLVSVHLEEIGEDGSMN